MSDVQELMLSRFLTLYGEPKTDSLDGFFDEYERALRGFHREILQAAADMVIRAQEYRSWPTPGECVKACHVAAEKAATAKRYQSPADLNRQERNWPAPTPESKRRVREMIDKLKAGITVSGELSEQSKRMTGDA